VIPPDPDGACGNLCLLGRRRSANHCII
jgi:hypothetical protein